MEFRLNKIDTELRQMVNDAIKEGKVHGNKGVYKINKDTKKNKQDDKNNFKKQLDEKQKTKIVIEATKAKEIDVEASREDSMQDLTFGRFLDIKR